MKIRTGFVSNSSSSSYVCDVCGYDVSGYDICLSDYDMKQCNQGHIWCSDHDVCSIEEMPTTVKLSILSVDFKVSDEELEEIKDDDEKIDKLLEDYMRDYRRELPSRFCPICTFQAARDEDLIRYVYKKYNISEDNILEEIRSKFSSYDEFRKFLEQK